MDAKTERKLFALISVVTDLFIINLAFIVSYWVRFSFFPAPLGVPPFRPYLNALVVVSGVYLAVFKKFGFYSPRRGNLSIADEFYSTFVASSLGIIILVAVTFFYRDFEYSRLVIIIAWIIGAVMLGITRAMTGKIEGRLRARGVGTVPVIIAGTGKIAMFIKKKIDNHPGLGYKIEGFLGEGGENRMSG